VKKQHFSDHDFTYYYPKRTWNDRIQDLIMVVASIGFWILFFVLIKLQMEGLINR
jgi:hypothetical protein